MTDAEILKLAHRTAWRYKMSSDPRHSDTYIFNDACLIQFARKIANENYIQVSNDCFATCAQSAEITRNKSQHNPTWSSLLSAITQLKTERNNAIAETEHLKAAIKETIEENLDLADGENCTLIKLKKSIYYDDLQPLTDEEIAFQRWCD